MQVAFKRAVARGHDVEASVIVEVSEIYRASCQAGYGGVAVERQFLELESFPFEIFVEREHAAVVAYYRVAVIVGADVVVVSDDSDVGVSVVVVVAGRHPVTGAASVERIVDRRYAEGYGRDMKICS